MSLDMDPVYKRAWFNELVYQGCKEHGGSVVSGMRSVLRNTSVGGHLESRHLDNTARDCVFDTAEGCSEAFKFWRSRGLRGYIREDNPKECHIQADAPRKTAAQVAA